MSKSKRKLLISMLVAMFVLLSAVAIVAIAFALTQQTITTTLNIGYTVTDLDGSVYATYTVGGTKTYLNPNPVGGTVNGNSLVFSASDTQDAGTLDFPSNIDLSSTNDNIVIQYTYANTGDKHYIASMSFASNIVTDNMTVEYSTDGETYSTDRYAVVVPANSTEKSYWIKISISNKAKSASFSGDFQWNLSGYDKTDVAYPSLTSLEFSGSNGSYSASVSNAGGTEGKIIFPSEINGDAVTTISRSTTITSSEKAKITEVEIPDSVTKIGARAFEDYTNLETVTYGNSTIAGSVTAQSSTGLQTIGNYAFEGCSSLANITIPSTVTSIGENVFGYCSSIETITVQAGNTVYTSSNNCLLKGTELILGCKNSTIPSSVTKICAYAFYGCSGLTNVFIPSAVTSIATTSFAYCSGIESIEVDSSNSYYLSKENCLCTASFFYEDDMMIIVYGSDVTLVLGCKNSDITVGLSVTDTPITEIGEYAFSGCTGLTTLTVPSSITSIGTYAFANCTSLTELNLPTGLTSFYISAYDGCTSLTSIYIPKCVTDLEVLCYNSALYSSNLEGIVFEEAENITSIWGRYTDMSIPADVDVSVSGDFTDPAVALEKVREICSKVQYYGPFIARKS